MTELQLSLAAIPVFLTTILIEVIVLRRAAYADKVGYETKDAAASIAMGLGFLVLSSVAKLAIVPAYLFLHQFRLFDIPDGWATWAVLFLLQDFCFYWAHRTHHSVRFMWAAHVNHHSSLHYNLSTALRQSWTEHLTALPFYVPLVLLGFDPLMLFIVELINLFYQYGVHTEAVNRLGWFEWVFSTPSHHRVHHGSNPKYIDKNHGGILIIWDRMFGSFQREEEPVTYGLTRNIDTFNPVRIAFHEWRAMIVDVRKADTVTEALGYVFRPPGWTPHGANTRTASSATIARRVAP